MEVKGFGGTEWEEEGQPDPFEEAEVDGLEPSDSSAKDEDEPREPFLKRVEVQVEEADEDDALVVLAVVRLGRLKAWRDDWNSKAGSR